MLGEVLLYAGLICVALVVILSIETRFYIKRKAKYSADAAGIERDVRIRMVIRTVLTLLAPILLIASHVTGS